MKNSKEAYAGAGVNIDAADEAKSNIARMARSTFRPEVLTEIGLFGGFFEFKGYKQPVLVSSCDGVGTKLKIAKALGKYDTVGVDLVNHCVNDIFTGGAEPLFFLDYIAMDRLVPGQVESIVKGLVKACKENGCALIGGETAQMPGIYRKGEYDLAGFIVGVVEKDRIILGKTIRAGDAIIGLPSNGLHTNGYSLARRVFGESKKALNTFYPELGRTAGEALLETHRCYYPLLKPLLPIIKGMAHITGGGLIDNVPRVLPLGLSARFESSSWTLPPVFQLLQERGNIDREEMYRVFNMGIGMVAVCSPDNVAKITKAVHEAKIVGEIITQTGKSRVIID